MIQIDTDNDAIYTNLIKQTKVCLKMTYVLIFWQQIFIFGYVTLKSAYLAVFAGKKRLY